MKRFASLFLLLSVAPLLAATPLPHLAEKQLAAASIEKNRDQLTALSDEVWRYAETALKETKSSKALADFAEQKGFRVTRGVAGMPAWHPNDETSSDTKSTQAIVDVTVEFFGRAAHAAYDPWNGRSAVDGLEIFTHAVNMMREHVHPTSRMHYAILKGGDVPNVVPEYGKVWIWLRDEKRELVDEMLGRLRKIATGAAMAADVESKLTMNGGDWNMLVNMTGERLAQQNLEWLGGLQFTPEEQEFAKSIQRANKIEEKGLNAAIKPFEANPGPAEGGSTDVADISWNMPTIHLSVATAPIGAPWHGWSVVACGGMSIGHKGMILASKALAATMIDLFADPDNVK